MTTGPLAGDALFRDVLQYVELGEHRTASPADDATADWMTRELALAGLAVSSQRFAVAQFHLTETLLRVEGEVLPAFPLWPPCPTGFDPVVGPLAEASAPRPEGGHVALVRFAYRPDASIRPGSGHAELVGGAAARGARAVLAATEGPTGEIVAHNDESGAGWPVPVALVAPRALPRLEAAAARRASTSLVIDGRDDPAAPARNVVARLERGDRWTLVTTPRSGWFRCGGERGPGVALLLGLARWAAARPRAGSWLFAATSGHELGGVGMECLLDEVAPPPERVRAWLHLGAGIATWAWRDTPGGARRLAAPDPRRLLMCDESLAPLVGRAFTGQPGLAPRADVAVGELAAVRARGYRAFGIAAAHRFHHTPLDGAATTGPALLEPVATALARVLDAVGSLGTSTP